MGGRSATGHRMIGVLGAEALPDTVPGFLRTPAAVVEIGEIAREPDRGKGTGDPHDADLNPAHFADLDDQGNTKAGTPVADLPPTRAAYAAAGVRRNPGTVSGRASAPSTPIIRWPVAPHARAWEAAPRTPSAASAGAARRNSFAAEHSLRAPVM